MPHTYRGSSKGNRTPGVRLASVVLLSLAYVTIVTIIVTVVTPVSGDDIDLEAL